MKFQTFRRTLATCALALGSLAAQAALIVPMGSSYDFSIQGQVSGHTGVSGIAFDGVAKNFTRTMTDGTTLNMSITETQQDLGNGQFRILIDLRADGDIFPYQGPIGALPNDREFGYVGLGIGGDPMDLLASVRLDSVIMRLMTPSNPNPAGDEFIGFVQNTDPWDGTMPKSGYIVGYNNAGNFDVNGIQLELLVSTLNDVPEPQSLALVGLALLAAAGARRRRQSAR